VDILLLFGSVTSSSHVKVTFLQSVFLKLNITRFMKLVALLQTNCRSTNKEIPQLLLVPEGPLPCTQKPITGTCRMPDEFNPYNH
jgi:hypothetical protein